MNIPRSPPPPSTPGGQPRRWRWTAGAIRATTSSTEAEASGSSRITWRRITTPTICAAAACTRSGSTGPTASATRPISARPDELAQHRRALLAGHRRPQHAEHRGPELGTVPGTEEQPHQPLPQAVRVAGEHLRQHLAGLERQLHGGDEDLLLGAEVVVHQCRVHPGLPGDAAHARGLVAGRRELLPRGGRGSPYAGRRRPPAGRGRGAPEPSPAATRHDAHHARRSPDASRPRAATGDAGGAHPRGVRPSRPWLTGEGQPPAWVAPLAVSVYGAYCCTCSVGSS